MSVPPTPHPASERPLRPRPGLPPPEVSPPSPGAMPCACSVANWCRRPPPPCAGNTIPHGPETPLTRQQKLRPLLAAGHPGLLISGCREAQQVGSLPPCPTSGPPRSWPVPPTSALPCTQRSPGTRSPVLCLGSSFSSISGLHSQVTSETALLSSCHVTVTSLGASRCRTLFSDVLTCCASVAGCAFLELGFVGWSLWDLQCLEPSRCSVRVCRLNKGAKAPSRISQ